MAATTTTTYAIAELKPTERGGFAPRGAVRELWRYKGPEVIIAGPAETGKTWGALNKLDALMWKYPGAQAAIVRKTYQSLHGTVLQTYRRILGRSTPVVTYGGERPQWYDYPNGSRVFVGGMDNPQKVLSSERDIIYINQAEELDLDDYETLTTRATGRGAVMPYTQIMGDCNPGPPGHWIKQREAAGTLRVLNSRHEDNPTLYDEDGQLTEQGVRTMAVLDALTGVRYKRLRLGLWVGAEGMVYEGYDPGVHLINRRDIPADWPRYRVIDFGFTNPFVCQWWARDPDGRLYRYREIYRTQRLVEDHARDIRRLSEGETYAANIADHDAEDRATLRNHGVPTIAANKDVSPGLQAVAARLKIAGDGKPRIFLMRDSLVERDPALVDAKLPTCTEEEFEGYIWQKVQDGAVIKEVPVKQNDHGMDAMRYMVYHLDRIGKPVKYTRGID